MLKFVLKVEFIRKAKHFSPESNEKLGGLTAYFFLLEKRDPRSAFCNLEKLRLW